MGPVQKQCQRLPQRGRRRLWQQLEQPEVTDESGDLRIKSSGLRALTGTSMPTNMALLYRYSPLAHILCLSICAVCPQAII